MASDISSLSWESSDSVGRSTSILFQLRPRVLKPLPRGMRPGPELLCAHAAPVYQRHMASAAGFYNVFTGRERYDVLLNRLLPVVGGWPVFAEEVLVAKR